MQQNSNVEFFFIFIFFNFLLVKPGFKYSFHMYSFLLADKLSKSSRLHSNLAA